MLWVYHVILALKDKVRENLFGSRISYDVTKPPWQDELYLPSRQERDSSSMFFLPESYFCSELNPVMAACSFFLSSIEFVYFFIVVKLLVS